MTSLYMVGGGVILFVIVVGILVGVSKASGKSTSERDSLQDGQSRRDRFDEIMATPRRRQRELLDKLRRNLGR